MANSPNPYLSICLFIGLTITYFILKYYLKRFNTTIFILYILALIAGQYGINVHLTEILCGSPQTKTATLYTFIPWLVIFGGLNIVLTIFPSWLMPFSNSIGYGIAKLTFDIPDIFNKILKFESNIKPSAVQTEENPRLYTYLQQIYNDKSLLINTIPDSNEGFDDFWRISEPLFKQPIDLHYKEELRKIIKFKNIIAELTWYTLTGLLVLSASYNFIIKSACINSVQEMEQKHKEYETKIKDVQIKKQVAPRVYSSYE